MKILKFTITIVTINITIKMQVLKQQMMLNYKTTRLSISKTMHDKECLFRIGAAPRPQGRNEQRSIKHSALETPSDAMDLCWCKRSLHLRTMAIGLASWPFIPGEEMQKKFTSHSPGQGKEAVIPIFQAKYESTFRFCVSMMMIIFFDPTNHNQIALCSVFWLSNVDSDSLNIFDSSN